MVAVDTNVLVRLVTRDDPHQTAEAESFVQDGAWVSQIVLAEATRVLENVYFLRPTAIADVIHMLLEHENLVLQESPVVAQALDQFRAKPALGFSDCLILEVARAVGHLPLGTFDRKFARLDGTERL